jgi:SAM-dependent methyltransferase
MIFTPEGLEQATRLSVAARHARRFAAAGVRRIADLGCGIGGDALAFAGLGLEVIAVEIDEATAACATVNLRRLPQARVRLGDALALDLRAEGVDGVWADPARRSGSGRRVFDPEACTPPLAAVLGLRETVPALGVKVAPGISYAALPPDTRAIWVSDGGDVVEAGLWFGPLAPEGPGRSALLLTAAGAVAVTGAGPPGAPPEPAPDGPLEAFLYEPDGAVIRAGLVDHVCREVDGHLVDHAIAYVTAAHLVPTPLATAYRVLDRFPFGLKRLRAYLRGRGVGRVTIKKRGTAVDPATLRRQLDLRGREEATLVLTRVGGAQSVLVVEPAG